MYNLGDDSNYFNTASIGHIRTFDSTIEFVNASTKIKEATLTATSAGISVKGASNQLTSISGSNGKFTGKLAASSFRGQVNGQNDVVLITTSSATRYKITSEGIPVFTDLHPNSKVQPTPIEGGCIMVAEVFIWE